MSFNTKVSTPQSRPRSQKQRFGADVEGVMGMGGWDADAPESQNYLKRHVEMAGQEPDRWAGPVTYASLQMLQQAIERVGAIDRAAAIKELQTGTFETILGPVKLENNLYTDWWIGQWQNGEFHGIAPATLTRGPDPGVECVTRSVSVLKTSSKLMT